MNKWNILQTAFQSTISIQPASSLLKLPVYAGLWGKAILAPVAYPDITKTHLFIPREIVKTLCTSDVLMKVLQTPSIGGRGPVRHPHEHVWNVSCQDTTVTGSNTSFHPSALSMLSWKSSLIFFFFLQMNFSERDNCAILGESSYRKQQLHKKSRSAGSPTNPHLPCPPLQSSG